MTPPSAKLARQLTDAVALHQRGDLAGAENQYRAVLKDAPQQVDALHLLGVLLDQRGQRAQGIALVRKALAVNGGVADIHFNLARMLAATGDTVGAKRHYDQALLLKPGHAMAHNGLGVLYRALGQYAEASAAFERALRFEPRLIDAHINLCNTYRDTCNEAAILKVADQGLKVDPNSAQLWLLRSEAAFMTGSLAEGWRDYIWRFQTLPKPDGVAGYGLPLWKGEDLAGKGILLWGEQGVGDEIIFASLVPGISARAARCVLQTSPRLAPLFRRAFPNVEVFGGPVPAEIVKQLDVQSALADAGQWQRPNFRTFPANGVYLKADAAQAAARRAKYKTGREGTMLVGIAWRSVNAPSAGEKTVTLNHWAPILSIPGVTFVNLQYGESKDELTAAARAFRADVIHDDEVDPLTDLDAFAAQVAALDLVITTSNAAAHVAGALGVPTFCLIPRALGAGRRWYWFANGPYAPWYRSMTLFRQKQPDTWSEVIGDVAWALAETAGAAGAPGALRAAAHERLKRGHTAEALAAVATALQKAPELADSHNIHGMALVDLGRFEEAAAAYRAAIARKPDSAAFYNNLGTALRRAGHDVGASNAYAEAHRLAPDHPSIFLNHAMALAERGVRDGALDALDALVARQPNYVDAQYNRALVLMALGRLKEGWQAMAWRLKRSFVHVRHSDFPQPVWSGEPLAGKHILVWTDLGLGEEILVASLIPELAAVARQVTLLCSERLLGLFRRSFPNITVAQRRTPLPAEATAKDIDLQMSLAELGAAFRPNLAAFPDHAAYLAVDPSQRDALRAKYLARAPSHRLIGIAWRSINPEIGALKSFALTDWLPFLKTPGVTFVNLQYGDSRAEVDALAREHGVAILDDPEVNLLGDIDAVAAQVAAMDKVISISNTTVHLAGALGVPAWMLLPTGYARLWYWFAASDRCAWYPSVTFLEGSDAVAQAARQLAQTGAQP